MLAETITNAVLAELQQGEHRTPQAWAGVRRRVLRVVEAKLNEAPAAAPPTEGMTPPGEPSPVRPGSLLTTHDVARLVQVDASTVSKWIDQGKLKAFRTPGGHRRIRQEDFDAFLVQFQIPITGSAA